jgi:hypothetical protein
MQARICGTGFLRVGPKRTCSTGASPSRFIEKLRRWIQSLRSKTHKHFEQPSSALRSFGLIHDTHAPAAKLSQNAVV